jgi:hypothetical protein
MPTRLPLALLSAALLALTTVGISAFIESCFSKNDHAHVYWYTLVSAIAIAPVLETLVFQVLPFKWAEFRKIGTPLKLIIMSTPFALAHAAKGVGAVVEAQIGGLLLSALYIHWSKVSRPIAFATTSLAHLLHNVITAAMMFHAGAVLILK